MDKKDVYSMWEDSIGVAPTNSASGGAIAGLPPDEPPIRKRKSMMADERMSGSLLQSY